MILARDHAFQEAFAGADQDRATTLSALESLQQRVRAEVLLVASLDHKLLFDTHRPQKFEMPFPFPKLIARAEESGTADAFVLLDRDLYVIAVTPLLAPAPIAWLCPAFHIDDEFAREIKRYTDSEITFASADKIFASTFGERGRAAVRAALQARPPPPHQIVESKIGREKFLSYVVPLAEENGSPVALLQRSLDQELAPSRQLERTYLSLALLGLAISAALGLWIARGVAGPVLQLTSWARKIAAGDYQHREEFQRDDEIGSLAVSFNQMTDGLAERDRVRDLLGKVVSPEVAAELLRKDVVLGGEEREVTILFSDLRGFTSMSERLGPQQMLGILNDYFTRMAAIVERHGGVVDKYVGDALMALFGAPLTAADDADRALRVALEMTAALDEINQHWAERGLPTLEVGIGINTDRVVAGNMGSTTRLNYTVIGDGVNLASRLEGLTKTPGYETRIIVSAATLAKARGRYQTRRLGEVAVKGKQKPTEIFALLAQLEEATGTRLAMTPKAE